MRYERSIGDNVNEKEYVFKFTVTEAEIQKVQFDKFDQELIDLCKKSGTISGKIMALQILARAIEWYEEHKNVLELLEARKEKENER